MRRIGSPVIRQLIPPPPYGPQDPKGPPLVIRVVGESLSPLAQVRLNGMLLSPGEVLRTAPPSQDPSELVSELVLQPLTVARSTRGVRTLKIINPDGQIAEF